MAGRLLIVDDYGAIRVAVKSLLVNNGFAVCGEAGDGAEAVRRAQELHPDLVILDINMPVKNGFEAAEEIRLSLPGTKILFFTDYDSLAAAEAFHALGDDCVSKSAASAKLVPTVARLLRADRTKERTD